MQIEVREAALKTFQVSIQALLVSGKQMTLAVFRQLDESRAIDRRTGEVTGKLWGRVNYHSGCDREDGHIHCVFEMDGSLYRDSVGSEDWQWRDNALKHSARKCIDALAYSLALEGVPFITPKPPAYGNPANPLKIGTYTLYPSFAVYEVMGKTEWNRELNKSIPNWEGEAKETLNQSRESMGVTFLESKQWWVEYERLTKERIDFKKKWQEGYEKIAALPHLFIAV